MPYERINGVNLYYERTSSRERMVMVHGSRGFVALGMNSNR